METPAHMHHISTAASCQKVEPAMARLLNKRPNLWHLERKVWVSTRYSLQTSSPDTGVDWQSALRGVFFSRSLWHIRAQYFCLGPSFVIEANQLLGICLISRHFYHPILPAFLPWPFIFSASNLGPRKNGILQCSLFIRAAPNGKTDIQACICIYQYMNKTCTYYLCI